MERINDTSTTTIEQEVFSLYYRDGEISNKDVCQNYKYE